jgi:hypothetical protein
VKCTLFALSSWLLAPSAFAILDTNNNGVSDFWEKDVHNGSLFDGYFDLFGDTDADGWTNGQEAAAGTNPFDPNPPEGIIRPDIVHTPAVWGEENGVPYIDTPEAVTVTWPTITGKRYRLLVSTDLSQGSWIGVPNSDFISNGNIPEFHFTTAESDKLFWRVTVEDIDSDSDGLNDYEEQKYGTNPTRPMTFPGIPDAWLAANYTSPQGFTPDGDTDGDGLNNSLENRLGLDPNSVDTIGLVNPGFDEDLTGEPDLSFREEYPSDLYHQESVPSWLASIWEYVEIWDENDGNPYVELQSHLGSHGIKQEFDMLPGSRINFILRYKGRYDFDACDNEFKLEVEGSEELLINGTSAAVSGDARSGSFMQDDEWEKYNDWHYATASIIAPSGSTGLKAVTLSLVPQTTTTYGENGEEEITYGGFIDLLPVDLDVNGDGDLDDSCDGLALYMPGYEGNQPKLHTGDSFKDAEYAGPQSMNIIIDDLPSGAVDEATVRITSSSAWFGFCGNGKIPNDSPILSYNDFSLTGEENVSSTQEISIPVTGNQVIIPIYCHDYGAWCEVEIDLLSGGSSILSQPLSLTVPHDGNDDRLADLWQDSEISAWNDQFGDSRPINDTERDKMKPGPGYDYSDYADDEEDDSDGTANGDGGRNLPAMASDGDGLSVIEEYRGYVLDLGSGVTPGVHKRQKTARKEVLLQIHKMAEITDPSQNNANAAAQQFDLDARFQAVADFYANTTKGAALDLYGVNIPVSDSGPVVTYADASSRPSAYKWNGKLEAITGSTRPATGGSYIYRDRKLEADFPLIHEALFEFYVPGQPGRLNIFPRVRDYDLSRFGLCVMFTRLGKIEETSSVLQAVENTWGNATTNHGSTVPDPNYERRGVQLSVNSISEETSPAYTSSDFNDVIDYSFAHEIGHMLLWSQTGGHYGAGQTLMSATPPVPVGLGAITIDDGEVQLIDIQNRLSTLPQP